MTTCCRLSQHLRCCDVGFYSRARLRSFMAPNNFVSSSLKPYDNRLQRITISSSASSHHVSPGESPVLADCFSQQEDDREVVSEGRGSVAGGIVALGKFDALHIGHRELAIQASKVGIPFLVSFVGMAEVLGWEPRAPIVAKCDRKRVLSSWAPYCGNVAPVEFPVEFSSVRHLTPQQFVEKLSKELGVIGIVAGENYRFGYKAAGDASELVRLCEEYGMRAYIVSSVMDKHQSANIRGSTHPKERGQVSSTRVRHALAEGDMKYVSELLGRKHRLMLMLSDQERFIRKGNRVSAPKTCLLNLPPNDGLYENCSFLVDDVILVPCSMVLDATHIHMELDENSAWSQVPLQDCSLISIEFGDSKGVC